MLADSTWKNETANDNEQIEKEALQLFDYSRTAERITTDQLEDGKEYVFYQGQKPLENIVVASYDAEEETFELQESAYLQPRLWVDNHEEGLSIGYMRDEDVEVELEQVEKGLDKVKMVESDHELVEEFRDTDLYKDARFDL